LKLEVIIPVNNPARLLNCQYLTESSGQILAGLLPPGARPVKAFGTLSATSLSAAARREPERAVLFYAAGDDAAGDLVADLIRIGGYEPVRVGGLDQSIRLEVPVTCTNTAPWVESDRNVPDLPVHPDPRARRPRDPGRLTAAPTG
jgi:predicted dinucleotide-binding enzyme